MKIEDQCVVSIHYTLTDDEGEVIDTSEGREPLDYLHGAENIVPGLENALSGKSTGDKLQVTVQPDEGYGPVDPELVQKIPRNAFEGVDDLQPGMQFQAEGPDGQPQIIIIDDVCDDGVVVDGNHPLAGMTLNFDVSIESVRAATQEELDHGHTH